MKIRLPYLSALALTVLLAAAVAQSPLVRGQSSGPIAPPPGFVDRRATEDTTAYTSEPATAADSQATEDQGLPVGDRLMRQAMRQLAEHESITAKLQHRGSIDGAPLYGVGSYWQQGKGEDVQTRLELQIAGQDASLLQASNGRKLWIDRRLPSSRVVTCIDLFELRDDLAISHGAKAPTGDDWATEFEIRPRPAPPDSLLIAASGGLRGLLASLSESFTFMPPQAMVLSITPTKSEQNVELPQKNVDLPVYVVVGHWRPERLSALVHVDGEKPKEKEANAPPKEKPVPNRLPQEVLLLFGKADLFPYRIEYRGLETPPASENGTATVYQLSANPLITLELSEVNFNAPLASGLFDYTPQNAVWSYQTPAIRERLRGQRQQKVAEKVRPSAR